MDIKDAPDRILPSAEKVEAKLEKLQANIEDARHLQVHDKNLENYSKIQQVLKDASRVVDSTNNLIKDKTEDGTLGNAAQETANLLQEIVDESWFSLDKLWTNWTALVTVLAAGSAGSWKTMIQESGRLLNDLRNTEDFVKLLNDLKGSFGSLMELVTKNKPVGDKMSEANKQWEAQRDKLLEDLKGCWGTLAKSPIFTKLLAQGKAFKEQAKKVGEETKDQLQESADRIKESENLKKLKDDLKNILQLIVGKDGPSVQPFLDYSFGAWDEIMTSENYSKWADEASCLFDTFSSANKDADQEAYEKRLEELYTKTKDILDTTVKNENLRLALRESKKLIKAAKKDPATRKLIASSQKLLHDVSNNKGTGVSPIDPALLNEIRAVLVPVLVHHFDNCPIPDYHNADSNALGKFDYHLTGIRLGTTGLVPNKVKIEFRYKTVANPAKLQVEQQHMYMYIYIEDIQVAFKDVKWAYNRHTLPRFSDNGTLDLCTAGKGISFTIKAEVHDYREADKIHSLGELLEPPKEFKMFEIIKADCTIDDFHVNITDTSKNTFYEMLAGIWGTKIKHQIEAQIEAKMRILATRFDRQLYDIIRRTTQPSLTADAKSTIMSAGEALTEKLTTMGQDIKQNLQSL